MSKLGVLDVCGAKYTLKLGETYIIGLKCNDYNQSHDIEVDDTSVDIKHCILDCTEKSAKLIDLRSKCGTFVDGMRVEACKMFAIVKSTTIQFGNVEATIELLSESDSGYLEGRLNSPSKDTSEIICNSPEQVSSSGSRLKHNLKNSHASTSGAMVTSNILIQSVTKATSEFLVPTGVVRKSNASNTSTRSVDSFYIPETQCPMDNNDKTNNSVNVSIDTNKTNNQSIVNPVGTDDDEDDFFIPETQDIGSVQVDRLSNYPRLTFQNDDVNEGVVDVAKIPSSQFRICTQDFNGSCDDLSNCSEDMLSTVPCSIIIPPIRHDTVHIDDLLNRDEDELEIEKEMSLLQWSKQTDKNVDNSLTPDIIDPADGLVTPDIIDPADGLVTPDIIDPADGLVTPDIIEGIELSKGNSKESDTREDDIQPTQVWIKPAIEVELPVSKEETIKNQKQSAFEQVGVISKETDEQEDIPPTQVWIKPASLNNSIAKVSFKENIVPQDNDIHLMATQVFKAPPKTSAVSPSLLPPPSLLTPPPSALQPQVSEDDDLPPTQVFEKVVDKQINNICLSSTLLDHGMQLAESSFKRNCNKFLDSDDDEMSDTAASEIEKKDEMPFPLITTPNQKTIPSPVSAVKLSNKKDNASFSSRKLSKPPSNDEFRVPQSVTKKKTRPEPAVSIDDFLLTPDFLKKGFCKDTHLQHQVEKNWKSIISEKQRTALFGEEDSDGNPLANDSDSSQDSFDDLLPLKVVNDVKEVDKVVKSKKRESDDGSVKRESDDGRRSARRRNAPLEEETSEKKVPRKSSTQIKVESDKPLKNDSLKAKNSEKCKKGETMDIPVEKNNKSRDKIKNAEESKKERKKADKQPSDENSKKISLSKKQKPLFGTVDSDSDISKDSIDDLLPLNVFITKNTLNKEVIPKAHEEDVGMRITRRRKSKLEEEHKEKKVSKKSSSQTKPELKKHSNKVKNDDKNNDEGNYKQVGEKKVAVVPKVEAKPTDSATKNQDADVSNKEKNKKKPEAEKKSEEFHEKLTRGRLLNRKVKKSSTSEDVSKQKISNNSKEESREHSHNSSSSSSHSQSNKHKSMDRGQNKSNKKEQEEKNSAIVSDKQKMNTSKESSAPSKDKKEVPKKNKEKHQEEKPVARVTRLRSATVRGKDNLATQGVKLIVNELSNVVIYDLTRDSPEPTTKRKNTSYEPRNKRLKSSSSMDSVTSIPSLNESQRSIRARPQKPKIAMTMCEAKYQDLLERYSGTLWFITTDPKECDVMVVEKGNRTYKIMIAIARGIPIVKLDWFRQVVKTKSVQIPYDKYIFDDTTFQERHQFDMKKALSSAKERSLFNGISFLMTPGIRPVPTEMKDIIVCSGGTVHDDIPKPKADQQIYLVSSQSDNQYWHKYRRTNPNIKIVTSDGVMSSVMQQSEVPLKKSIIL